MVKVLVIGDPHFKSDNAIDTDKLEQEVLSIIKERQVDSCVVLGDVMHDHGMAKMKVFNRACNFLVEICKLLGRDKTFLLIGNHDRVNNKISEGDDHFFRMFKKDHPHFPTVVDEAKLVEIETKKFVMVQYVSPGELMSHIERVVDRDELLNCDAVFLHQELKGCQIGNKLSENGDEWDKDLPLAVCGHIHEYQRPARNIIYPGTPFQVTFGCPRDKSVMILNWAENGLEIEKIKIDVPQKLLEKLSCREFADYVIAENSWIKFKIKDTKSRIKAMKSSQKYLECLNNHLIRFSFCCLEDDPQVSGTVLGNRPVARSSFKERLEDTLRKQKSGVREIFESLIK